MVALLGLLLCLLVPAWAQSDTTATAIEQARNLIGRDALDEASTILKDVLKAEPGNPQALYWMANIYDRREDFDQALNYIEQTVQAVPGNLKLQMEQARILTRAGRMDEAAGVYERIRQEAKDPALVQEAARLQAIVEDQRTDGPQTNLQHYQDLYAQQPDDPSVGEGLARTYATLKRWDDAEQVLRDMLAKAPHRLSTLQELATLYEQSGNEAFLFSTLARILELEPNGPFGQNATTALLRRGRELLRDKDYTAAATRFGAVLKALPEHAAANMAMAETYKLERRPALAQEAYQKVLKTLPDDFDVMVRLAHLYVEQDEIDKAIALFEQVLEKDGRGQFGREADTNLYILYAVKAQHLVQAINDDTDLTASVENARDWFKKGRIEAAKRVLTAVLERSPSDAEANYWLGMIYDRRGELALATKHVGRSYALQAANMQILLTYGSILAQAGRAEAAQAIYRTVMRRTHDQALITETHHLLDVLVGQQLVEQQRWSDAIAHFTKMLQQDPNDYAIEARLGSVYSRLGQLDQAEMLFKHVIDSQPNDPSAYMRLAGVYQRRGDIRNRDAQLKQILDIDPIGPFGQRAAAELGMAEAARLAAEKRWPEALESLRRFLTIDPDNIYANLGIGTAYIEMQRYEEAEEPLRAVLSTDPSNLDAQLYLARLLVATDRIDEAIIELERIYAVARDTPKGREALNNLTYLLRQRAEKYLAAGEIRAAVIEYERAINRDPDDWGAHFGLADIYQRGERRDDALKELQEVVRIKPDHVQAYVREGSIYELGDQFQQAMEAYVNALAYLQNDPELEIRLINAVRLQPVQVSLRRGEVDWSLKELGDMVASEPDNPTFRTLTGLTHTQQNDRLTAIEDFEHTLRITPDNDSVRFRLALLYEQTSQDALAAEQYLAILRRHGNGRFVSLARERLPDVQDRLRLFTYQLQYNITSGVDQSETYVPTKIFNSRLDFDMVLRLRPNKNTNLAFSFTPSYAEFHTTEDDSLAPQYGFTARVNQEQGFFLAGASRVARHGLLLEEARGKETNAYMSVAHRLDLPVLFGDKSGQGIPQTLQFRESFKQFDSENLLFLKTRTSTAALVFTNPFRDGASAEFTYSYAVQQENDALARDYAQRAHNLNLLYRRALFPRASGYVSLSGELQRYTNPDSRARAATGLLLHRRNQRFSMAMGLLYQLQRDITLYMDFGFVKNDSNMSRGFIYNAAGIPVGIQSATLADYRSGNVTAGMRFSF